MDSCTAGLRAIVDGFLSSQGASAVAMLTQFMNDWFDETRKWVDAVIKTAAAESDHNREVLQEWTKKWSTRAATSMFPIVKLALGDQSEETVAEEVAAFNARMKKIGIDNLRGNYV